MVGKVHRCSCYSELGWCSRDRQWWFQLTVPQAMDQSAPGCPVATWLRRRRSSGSSISTSCASTWASPLWQWIWIGRQLTTTAASHTYCRHAQYLLYSDVDVECKRWYFILLFFGRGLQERDFNWNSKEQGLVLGSFFYGYVTTQMLGGFLAPIIGASRLIGIGILGNSLLALITPVLAYEGIASLMTVRIFQGIFQV